MKNHSNKTQRRHGFTLLEVLLVLAILIAIAAMVVPNLIGRGDEANKDITRINIANFEKAAQMYRIDNKRWPEGGAQEVLELLIYLHERGVVHRDIKPANLMRANDGRLVLIDFNAVRIANQDPKMGGRTWIGTLPFMALAFRGRIEESIKQNLRKALEAEQ